jgi:SAM-dependent methyltransferase
MVPDQRAASEGSSLDDLFRQVLGGLQGGRVLDLATGQGSFAGLLMEALQGHDQIVGVDSYDRAIEAARAAIRDPKVHFVQMDAGCLGFPDACFDTVTLSASVHHLDSIPPVLAEAVRVLGPGGCLLLAEMHNEGRTEPQGTAVALHHWFGAVDTALGMVHNPTLSRRALLGVVEALGLDLTVYDWPRGGGDPGGDPLDREVLAMYDGVIDRYQDRARETSAYGPLRAQGEALRRRLHEVGVQREPVVIVVGVKG